MGDAQGGRSLRVLDIGQSRVQFPWAASLRDSFRSTLLSEIDRNATIEETTANMDQAESADARGRTLEHFRHDIMPRGYDLVVTRGNASRFAVEHAADLFAGVPVVLTSLEPKTLRGVEPPAGMAAVFAIPDVAGTVEAILSLLPRTRRLTLVAGTDARDREFAAAAIEALAPHRERLVVENLTGSALPEVLARLGELPADSAVLLMRFSEDAAGQRFVPRDLAGRIARASAAPVFTVWEQFMGMGVVGGLTLSPEDVGAATARQAMRLLAGERPAPVNVPSRPIFDWREMARWDIPARSLPPGAEVRNAPRSIAGEYPWIVAGGLILMLLQAALIAFLVASSQRRRVAEVALRRTQDNLEATVAERTGELALTNEHLAREVEERRQAEGWLRESRETLDQALRGAGLGVWSVNLTTMIPRGEAHLWSQIGYAPGEVPDDLAVWMELVHPDDRPSVEDAFNAATAGTEPVYESRHRLRAADGSWRSCLCRGRVTARDAAGRPTRMAGVTADMTGLNELEEQLREAKEAAEDANRTKSAFLASMSHEIRTPMVGVLGMLELLQGTSPAPEQARWIKMARTAAEGLLAVINDILDFSRIEAGKLTLRPGPFDLRLEIESVLDILRTQADAKGITLDAEVAPEVPGLLEGDAGRIRQVLLNLAGNAVKFTEHGGVRLSVTAEPIADGRLLVAFIVKDTGPGIPPEMLANIFEPFVQAEGAFTRTLRGTGLGLSIVKRLADLMDGDVTLSSAPGGGSTATFRVPLAAHGRLHARPRAREDDAPVARPLRLLVAEDQESNAELLESMLHKLGHSARLVRDGGEVLAALAEESFDAVLMDVQMPRMSGLDALRAIREGGVPRGARGVPVVAVSAFASREDRERFLAAGMNAFLAKPFNTAQLARALNDLCGGRPRSADAVKTPARD